MSTYQRIENGLRDRSTLASLCFSALLLLIATPGFSATTVTTTATAAARMADQTSFGPTAASIKHIQTIGLSAYVTEQLAAAPYLVPAAPAYTALPTYCNQQYLCTVLPWYSDLVNGNDQLRERVALALSEMFTVSFNTIPPTGIPLYQNTLIKDAFANYKTLMKDMTLNPAMGAFLNTAYNFKPAVGSVADENYAREFMQLMTVGTCKLNIQGICQTYSGSPVPVYSQAQVQAFARVFTGWKYTSGNYFTGDKTLPMIALDVEHDTGEKALLNGVTLPAGQTAEQDLDDAISNVFEDGNLPPFVSMRLIQRLVTSNPSPEYVARVATVFENNGKGVRGDMPSVLTAILMDTEARSGDTSPSETGGHLREPILWLTGILRGLQSTPTKPDFGPYNNVISTLGSLGQVPFRPDNVFSFFSPTYNAPATSMLGPEFQLETASHVIGELTYANAIVYNQMSGELLVDFSPTGPLGKIQASSPGAMVDELGSIFLHSQMPAAMRTAILSQISVMKKPSDQIANAAYLVITSPQYKISN